MVVKARLVLLSWGFTALGILCALLSALRIECRSLADADDESVRHTKLSEYTATGCIRFPGMLRVSVVAATGSCCVIFHRSVRWAHWGTVLSRYLG